MKDLFYNYEFIISIIFFAVRRLTNLFFASSNGVGIQKLYMRLQRFGHFFTSLHKIGKSEKYPGGPGAYKNWPRIKNAGIFVQVGYVMFWEIADSESRIKIKKFYYYQIQCGGINFENCSSLHTDD